MHGLEVKNLLESQTKGKTTIITSSIYQLLHRLEKRGFLQSRWEQTSQGLPQAYYKTTEAGREIVRRYLEEVFSADRPIATAMGEITGQLFQYFKMYTD